MRGCLGFLVFAAILVTLLAAAVVQLVLPSLVAGDVEGSPLLRGQQVEVHVDTSVAGVLLHGRIDSIRITGTSLTEPNATIAALDLTLADVAIADHTFDTASGSLDGVTITTVNGGSIPIDTVAISGFSSTVLATVRIGATAAEAALRSLLQAAGVAVSSVSLGAGVVDVTIQGHAIQARLVTNGNQLVLDAGSPVAPIELLSAPAGGEWRIDTVDVTASGIAIEVAIDLG